MGLQRLPRDPEAQRTWARRLVNGLNIPPLALFRSSRESFGQVYERIFCRAYELGAEAALRAALQELDCPGDPCVGLPRHLAKSARAAARSRIQKAAEHGDRRQKGRMAA